jgi:hypothetical protein
MGGITKRHWPRLLGSLADDEVVSDTASVRGLLRHHLAHVTAALVFSTHVGAALFGLGNPVGFLVLAAFPAAAVLLDHRPLDVSRNLRGSAERVARRFAAARTPGGSGRGRRRGGPSVIGCATSSRSSWTAGDASCMR